MERPIHHEHDERAYMERQMEQLDRHTDYRQIDRQMDRKPERQTQIE
jgi:hypothetical protein